MQKQGTRDTAPELAIRRKLHALGLRYRVDIAPLPNLRRRADIVFGPSRVAVFVDGCFWHGCPEHGRRPTHANAGYWHNKILANASRDRNTDARLAESGWAVVRVWEHEKPDDVVQQVLELVRDRKAHLAEARGAAKSRRS